MEFKLITIALLSTLISCQNNTTIQTEKSNSKIKTLALPCDSVTNQTDINICVYERRKTTDSILALTYQELLKKLDNYYYTEKEYITTKEDSIGDLLPILLEKQALINTHKSFLAYQRNLEQLILQKYKGGSMTAGVMHLYAIKASKQQLELLTQLYNND